MSGQALTYERFRLLSVGMGELEVLAVADEPDKETDGSHWVYHRDDGYVIELTFSGGRVVRIDEVKGLS